MPVHTYERNTLTLVGVMQPGCGREFIFSDGKASARLPYIGTQIRGVRHDVYAAPDVVEIEVCKKLAIEKGFLMTQGRQ